MSGLVGRWRRAGAAHKGTIGLAVAGVICLVLAWAFATESRAYRDRGAETAGRVLAIDDNGQVRYGFEVAGRALTGAQGLPDDAVAGLAAGDAVTVRYVTDDPARNRIHGDGQGLAWLWSLLAGIVALGTAGVLARQKRETRWDIVKDVARGGK